MTTNRPRIKMLNVSWICPDSFFRYLWCEDSMPQQRSVVANASLSRKGRAAQLPHCWPAVPRAASCFRP
jgi:hypothetical protein